jgi:hypothetical protein
MRAARRAADLGPARGQQIELGDARMRRVGLAVCSLARPDQRQALLDIEALQGFADIGHVLGERGQRCEVGHIADDMPDIADRLSQCGDILRQRDHGDDLGEVGVGRRPNQQLELAVAVLVVSLTKPGSPAVARTEASRNVRLLKNDALAAVASDRGIRGRAAGASLLEEHRAVAADPLVNHPPPVDVFDVALLAGADETDRRDVDEAIVGHAVLAPCRIAIELLPMDESSPAGLRARDGLDTFADEQRREHQRIDAVRISEACRRRRAAS